MRGSVPELSSGADVDAGTRCGEPHGWWMMRRHRVGFTAFPAESDTYPFLSSITCSRMPI